MQISLNAVIRILTNAYKDQDITIEPSISVKDTVWIHVDEDILAYAVYNLTTLDLKILDDRMRVVFQDAKYDGVEKFVKERVEIPDEKLFDDEEMAKINHLTHMDA